MAGEWLLLMNTFYNAILLTFASQMTQTPLSKRRKWLVALASSYVGLWLFPSILSPIMSFVLLLVAFPSAKRKHALLLLIGSFCIGGLLTALQAYASGGTSMHVVWLLLAILTLLYVVRFFRLRWQLSQQQLIVSCEITIAEQHFTLDGFIDTGNTCIEPISALPVHFVAMPAVVSQLPKELVEAIKSGQTTAIAGTFREIFLYTVHGEGPLLAMRVDEMRIGQRLCKGHYIVFIEQRPTFGRAVDVILHCSMLPKN